MTLKQKKLIACAELAGLKHKACNCGCGREYWVAEYGASFQICLFATSLDAIVPVVIKWCGEDNERWFKFRDALEVGKSSMMIIQYYLSASSSQILDALLLAAGKMPKE